MLKLRRQGSITGHRCPVIRQHFGFRPSQIDHWLNREKHALLKDRTGSSTAIMQHVGRRVKHPSQPMAAEITHHGHTVPFDKTLDRMTDITKRIAGLHRLNAHEQRIMRHLNQSFRFTVKLASNEHPRGISIPAVYNHGDINVQDVAIFKLFVAGDPVTNDVIKTDTAGMTIALIANRRRLCASGCDFLFNQLVDFACGLADHNLIGDFIQDLCSQFSSRTHADKIHLLKEPDTIARLLSTCFFLQGGFSKGL